MVFSFLYPGGGLHRHRRFPATDRGGLDHCMRSGGCPNPGNHFVYHALPADVIPGGCGANAFPLADPDHSPIIQVVKGRTEERKEFQK